MNLHNYISSLNVCGYKVTSYIIMFNVVISIALANWQYYNLIIVNASNKHNHFVISFVFLMWMSR